METLEIPEEVTTKGKVRRSRNLRQILRRHKVPEADKELRRVTFRELLALNKPDWFLVVSGIIVSAIVGALFPLLAILFGEILRVSPLLPL